MIFTQCYVHELPYAKRLHDSLQKYGSSVEFTAVLIDEPNQVPLDFVVDFALLSIQEIGLSVFEELSQRYNWKELRNNCKPFVFNHLLKKYKSVTYVDPTTVFHNSPEIFAKTLDENNAFLVPQLLFAHQHPKENDALNFGIYHNGTIGLNRSETTDKWLAWWQHHTRFKGFFDPCVGMNTDRLCLEFAPIFFEKTMVLKHPGVNVGPWNQIERKAWLNGDKTDELISTNYAAGKPHKLLKINPTFGIPLPEYSFAQRTISPILKSLILHVDNFFNRYFVRIQH